MKKLSAKDKRNVSIALVVSSIVLLGLSILVVSVLDRSQWWVWLVFSILLTGAVAAIIIPFLLPAAAKEETPQQHNPSMYQSQDKPATYQPQPGQPGPAQPNQPRPAQPAAPAPRPVIGQPGGNQVIPPQSGPAANMGAQQVGGSDGFMFYGVMRPNQDGSLDVRQAAMSAISAISAITAESADRPEEPGTFSGNFSSPAGNVSISVGGIIDRVPWADAPADPGPLPADTNAQSPQPVAQALPDLAREAETAEPTLVTPRGAHAYSPDPPASSSPITDSTIARIPAGSIRLTFDDQTVLYLKDSIVIGRNPSRTDEFQHADVFAIMDERLSVSKTHAALTASNGAVIVKDLHSTNGTKVVDADGNATIVQPGAEVWATDGATIQLGSRQIRVGVGR